MITLTPQKRKVLNTLWEFAKDPEYHCIAFTTDLEDQTISYEFNGGDEVESGFFIMMRHVLDLILTHHNTNMVSLWRRELNQLKDIYVKAKRWA